MSVIKIMENFSPKNKSIKKVIFPLLFLAFLLFLLSLFYNQGRFSDISMADRNKEVLAKEEEKKEGEEEEAGRLTCGKEIPVGEAMEKTSGLLNAIITELEAIERNLILQIKASEEITKLTEQCNVSNCHPVCKKGFYQSMEICLPQSCSGQPCPETEIEAVFEQITNEKETGYYDKIERSKKEIWALINGVDGEIDKRELLCEKINEDIRTLSERRECNGLCQTDPSLVSCPKITAQEAIRRKLNLSRNEFDKCYVPVAELEKVGKILLNCDTVMSQNLPRETKTEEKGIPVCTSPHNWFCCY